MKKLIIILILSLSIKSYSQWTQVSIPTTENLTDIYFKDENIGFCIAENGVILKTIDAGNNWSIIQQNTNINYTNIVFYNNELVSFGVENGIKKYFHSLDEGITWVSENITLIPISLSLLNNDLFYTDFNTLNLYKFNDNQPSVIATDVGKFGVNNSTNEIIYVNYLYNTLKKSIDYGENWQTLQSYPSNFGSNQSTEAKIKSFSDTIITHYTYPASTSFSLDNGLTWQNTNEDSIAYCEIINSNLLLGISQNNLYSQINFNEWQQEYIFNGTPKKIYFFDNNLGFIIGENGLIYKTENGGLSINSNQILEKKLKFIQTL